MLIMQEYQKIKLWQQAGLSAQEQERVQKLCGGKEVTLQPFVLRDGCRFPAILVLPGGGYHFCSSQEGAPVAAWLNSLGISAFVLDYTVAPARHPQPLHDAQLAIRYIRSRAEEWQLDGQRIGVLGFSAGGHLAASLSNSLGNSLNNSTGNSDDASKTEPKLGSQSLLESFSARPDLAILCYPVISWGQFRHSDSMKNLLGPEPPAHLLSQTSQENAVHSGTPPTFLWHTAQDDLVPVENSYLYAMALQRHGIAHELHVYPKGEHGLGLASLDQRRNPYLGQWRHSCEQWLYSCGF